MEAKLNIGDIIFIGKTKAVVCNVYNLEEISVEVVYLNQLDKAINEDVVFVDGKWKFKFDGINGGYEDNHSRLSEFVRTLRGLN